MIRNKFEDSNIEIKVFTKITLFFSFFELAHLNYFQIYIHLFKFK